MRKKKILRITAVYLALSLLFEICYPTAAMALTGGPAQPESSAFTPVGTSDMVNLFSGDFNYNIPLLDVGGYPVNISYSSGISMDQEASWTGLGWNINPGAINRSMRGLPDDFKGDKVKKEFNVKPNQTYGANIGFGAAIAGFDAISLNFSIGAKYNNYTGVGFEQSANIAISAGESGKTSGTASLGLHTSAEGLDISPSISASAANDKKNDVDTKFGASVGTSFNSRSGLKALTISTSIQQGVISENAKKEAVFAGASSTLSTGCSISFTNPTYVPSISMPMKNLSVNTNFQIGVTVFSIDGTLNVGGYYSEQRLAQKVDNVPAYGYLYSEDGTSLDKVMLDFNREKDGSFTKNTPCLPLTNYSYDLYSVSGQGVGGMFRPFRSDLGYMFDSRATNTSDSYSLGVELAFANTAHGGVDVTINDVNSTSGKWTSNNAASATLKQRKKVDGDLLYEPYYFKEAGEKNVDSDLGLYNAIGANEPVRIGLINAGGMEVKAKNTFQVGETAGTEIPIPTNNYRAVRQRRNQLFSFINKKEYIESAVDKTLESSIYDGITGFNNDNHIGEITTTKPDGSRYVYGIPAYNTFQKEVTFNMSDFSGAGDVTIPTTATTGLIGYAAGTDNSTSNGKGIDNYYSSTELPAYAHSYLLTSVLSPDYVDVTGDGPSLDDYGTYTKFSYTKEVAEYHWRVPYEANKANFNEGLKTIHSDEQGNYIYGEKEIWILDKIETKNYVAIFTKKDRVDGKDRADGFDVAGPDGGLGSNRTKLLKKITLYSRPDYTTNISNLALATPIKEVHFVYDYSLCPGTLNNCSTAGSPSLWAQDTECEEPTNAGGKLTLKQIYFTYGKSNKAKLNPYVFEYPVSSNKTNPAYGAKDYDKWGNYKKNNTITGGVTNADFPYVDQTEGIIPLADATNYDAAFPTRTYKELADMQSYAWTLNKVTLPSGGIINVTYETDDYAYVQNRRAMQMFKLTGIGAAGSDVPTAGTALTGNVVGNGDILFFKLQEPVLTTTPTSELYDNYLSGISDLYFRFLMKINGVIGGYEYISGYAEGIRSYGYCTHPSYAPGGYYTYGWVQLNNVDIEDNALSLDVNPISKAGIQFARINTPREAYNNNYNPDPSSVTIESVVRAMADAGFISNIIQTFEGPNGYLYGQGYGQYVETNRSWIRLLNPNKKKRGGGTRVKQITISDEWAPMLANGGTPDPTRTFSYGQVYDYTITENGKLVSTGVASYEPLVGGDENPFRLPVAFSQKMKLAADYDYFQEEPFGESFFPSASVGYSKVTVKNIQYATVKRHATGSVVSEFYTAKDYPVITKRTPIDPRAKKTGALFSLLKLKVKDYLTASQGFSIELNDMHGKPKATWVYAEDQVAYISGVEYKYKSTGNRLNNEAMVLNKNGSIANAQVGIDYDFVADMREQKTDITNAGLQVNLYGFLVSVVPVVIPPILPTLTKEETRFRSASTTKVINHFGLLEETIAYDLGSKVSTKNLAYDSETGEVLLTKTKNEFNDEMYSFNFPSHLAYDRMGPGYKNTGVVLKVGTDVSVSAGVLSDPSNFLVPGDELQILPEPVSGQKKYWVFKEKYTPTRHIMTAAGAIVTPATNALIKVIRSGRRNQQAFSVATFASLVNPIDKNNDLVYDTSLPSIDETYNVLSAGATQYSEYWKTFCECGIDPDEAGNPYVLGTLGNWRTQKTYTFLSDRTQTKANGNSNIRKDGTYTFFKQFWSPASGSDWTVPLDLTAASPNWTWASEVTTYSPYGPELENKDALNRYSAAVYGYNNTLPIAVGANTQYRQVAYDNFEDYDFDDCQDDHFSYEHPVVLSTSGVVINTTESHSGRRSIKVPAGTNVKVTKVLKRCSDY